MAAVRKAGMRREDACRASCADRCPAALQAGGGPRAPPSTPLALPQQGGFAGAGAPGSSAARSITPPHPPLLLPRRTSALSVCVHFHHGHSDFLDTCYYSCIGFAFS